MSELPLLCNAQVVKNLLAGRQTQDRRPIPITKYIKADCIHLFSDDEIRSLIDLDIKPPYQVGDRLYVRETYALVSQQTITVPTNKVVLYRADADKMIYDAGGNWIPANHDIKWKPNIHMPKELARIWREVTGVRAGQLWDTTEADAKAEGFESKADFIEYMYGLYPKLKGVNFWNWVTEFKVITN